MKFGHDRFAEPDVMATDIIGWLRAQYVNVPVSGASPATVSVMSIRGPRWLDAAIRLASVGELLSKHHVGVPEVGVVETDIIIDHSHLMKSG